MNYLVTQIWLCLLAAFVLGVLVGWWLGRRGCRERVVRLEEKWRRRLEACRTERRTAKEELAACRDELTAGRDACETPRGGLKGGPQAAAVEPDDLKRVEGIGPKIEGLLNARGITTWKQLAETEVALLQTVLDDAGPRYRIHDPATWPQQADLAARGAWVELDELQDRLKGGRRS